MLITNYWFRFHGIVSGLGNYVFGVIHYEGVEDTGPKSDPFIDAEKEW